MTQPEPLRPLPVKRLAAAALLMAIACFGGYLLTPKWQAARDEQRRLADPLREFSEPQTPQAQLLALQKQIRANPQDSENGRCSASIISGATITPTRCWPIVRRCASAVRMPNFTRRWRRCFTIRPDSI